MLSKEDLGPPFDEDEVRSDIKHIAFANPAFDREFPVKIMQVLMHCKQHLCCR